MVALLAFKLSAADVTIAGSASTWGFDDAGERDVQTLQYGMFFAISEDIQSQMRGSLTMSTDAEAGNLLGARFAWHSSFLEISAGPSFSVFNQGAGATTTANLFQPGLGIGFTLSDPGRIIAKADTDFTITSTDGGADQAYLQRSELSLGFFAPHAVCTIGVFQKSLRIGSGALVSTTDFGVYTEAFTKAAPFRVAANFIYRLNDYYVAAASAGNRRIGNVVIGGGLTWAPHSDMSIFIDGDGMVYAFSLLDPVADLDKFTFNLRIGVTLRTNLKATSAD